MLCCCHLNQLHHHHAHNKLLILKRLYTKNTLPKNLIRKNRTKKSSNISVGQAASALKLCSTQKPWQSKFPKLQEPADKPGTQAEVLQCYSISKMQLFSTKKYVHFFKAQDTAHCSQYCFSKSSVYIHNIHMDVQNQGEQ